MNNDYFKILKEKGKISVYKCLQLSPKGNFKSPVVRHRWKFGVNTYRKDSTGFWVFWTRKQAEDSGYMNSSETMKVVRLVAYAKDLVVAYSHEYTAVFKKLTLPKQRTK